MTNVLKEFIEKNIKLVDDNNWRQLFTNAYDDCLMTSEMQDLHQLLLEADIFDSTQLRNDLLFEHIKLNLDFVRDKYKLNAADPNEMRVIDCYAAQFLRHYLNNTFGFYEGQALQFMWENQRALGITLEKSSRAPGQGSVDNYMIHYEL